MAQPPPGISVAQAVEIYADFFEEQRGTSKIKESWRINWPTKREILDNSVDISSEHANAWEVNLAIDVPAGPVRVLPERMVGGGIKEPVHFYTASPDANFDDKGSKHALHHDKWRRGELTGAEVPAVVAYPCHIEPRKQRFEIVANVHPFDFKSNPPFSTPVSHSLFSDSSLATLTQLKVEAGVEPPFHQGLHREDERIDGSPSSAHTTYLLLELSKRDPSVRSYSFTVFFRVLFRARIALQQGHFPQDPRSWVPWGRPSTVAPTPRITHKVDYEIKLRRPLAHPPHPPHPAQLETPPHTPIGPDYSKKILDSFTKDLSK